MQYITDAVQWLLENIWWPLQQFLKACAFAVGQFLSTLLDGILTVVLSVLNSLDIGTLSVKAASAWGLIDPNVAWMLIHTGVTTGLTIIAVSFMVRFVMNLIPGVFTRV